MFLIRFSRRAKKLKNSTRLLNITSVMLEFTFNWQTFETYIIKIRWRHAHNALCWSAVISRLKGYHSHQVHKEILAGRMKSDKLNWREIIYLVIYFISYNCSVVFSSVFIFNHDRNKMTQTSSCYLLIGYKRSIKANQAKKEDTWICWMPA